MRTSRRRLQQRAAEHGRSVEVEARDIPRSALVAEENATVPGNLAEAVQAIVEPLGGMESDIPPRGPIRNLQGCTGDAPRWVSCRWARGELRPKTDVPATGGTVSCRGHGGHRQLAFHVPEWRAHMARSAWRCHMTNFSNSSAGISPLYPAALKRSADGRKDCAGPAETQPDRASFAQR